ncbi:MAG: sigma-70 family RNA polymerase sigma factor, partial [Clostridia bacterium]|nr:sigma-70 family RNA polymerase sigma factor [Clostridia bacterium]
TPMEEHVELSDDTYDPEISFFRNEQYRELHRALKKLKPEYTQALWLYFFEELRDEEIAVIMRKSPNNVNVLLHRAKKALKTQLKKEGFLDEDIS